MKFTHWLFLPALLFFIESSLAQAPGCPDVDAGPDKLVNCGSTCTDLTARIFQSGQATDYNVVSIGYAPPFSFTGGIPLFVNEDDVWTNAISLPFNFCFYGNMYNKLIVGANGVISFDLTHAGAYCAFQFSASIPSPGPTAPVPRLTPLTGIYNNSINGAFHDMNPNQQVFISTPPFIVQGNINYSVIGTAPCRTFVVNYSTVYHYRPPFNNSCDNMRTTQQIVLYETTNVIEVYIKEKPACIAWEGGRAVIGLQNIDGTKGIAPPGRNTGGWTANNEAWRFTPSGAPTWTLTWYDAAMNAIGNTATVNVCPTANTTYTAKVVYQKCDNTTIEVQDQVNVSFAIPPTLASVPLHTTCGECNGGATITPTGGNSPFSYDIGTGTQSSGTFTGLCAGNYTVTVTDNASCLATIDLTINPSPGVTVTSSSTDETCPGTSDGTVTLVASGGAAPYTFDIGTGISNTTGLFSALAADTYTYTVTDDAGCTTSGTVNVAPHLGFLQVLNSGVVCHGECTAYIDVSATGATQYSIDNGVNFQTGNVFNNVCAGVYNIVVSDGTPCRISLPEPIIITEAAALEVSAVATAAQCNATCTGIIDNTATGGTAPYEYSIDNGANYQTGNQFATLCAGTYTVIAADNNGCTATTSATVNEPMALTVSVTPADATCKDLCNASIVINAAGGILPYSFSLPDTATTSSPITGLCAGDYELTVTDANSCTSTSGFTLGEPEGVTVFAGEDDSVRIGESIQLNGGVSDGSLSSALVWSPPAGLSCTNCTNPMANPTSTTIYTLSVNTEGCTYSDDVEIIAFSHPLVNIPNAFTPNDDGVNDIFFVTGQEIREASIWVFDRWGEKLFETPTMSQGWDGTFHGKLMQPGVYAYMVKVTYLTGRNEILTGSVTLLQ